MEGQQCASERATMAAPSPPYSLKPNPISNEDILFCIDVDRQSEIVMKSSAPDGRPYTRLDAIKQAILLFVHAKLAMNPNHRFAFTVLLQTPSWIRKEFSNQLESVTGALRLVSAQSSYDRADLTALFKLAAHEARKSRAQSRILRVILIYCRSSVPPELQWREAHKFFTLDVLYLHDRPSADNCPQKVFDLLLDAVENVSENEGYVYESGGGTTRTIFKNMCILLAHPQQRCRQDYIDFPRSLSKKAMGVEGSSSKEEEGGA